MKDQESWEENSSRVLGPKKLKTNQEVTLLG